MRDVLLVLSVIVFFTIGALYIAACAKILSAAGDIDEAVEPAEDDEHDATDAAELVDR
jgi:hypothetical protein